MDGRGQGFNQNTKVEDSFMDAIPYFEEKSDLITIKEVQKATLPLIGEASIVGMDIVKKDLDLVVPFIKFGWEFNRQNYTKK